MARPPRQARNDQRLDLPKGARGTFASPFGTFRPSGRDRMGRFSESFARAKGTAWLLNGMSGVGAARLFHGKSEGSGMMLSPGDLAEVKAAADDDIVFCPDSGCILVRSAEWN